MITEKQLKPLLDKAHRNINKGFNPRGVLFLERIKQKIKRHKKLNETEERTLKDYADGKL